MRSPVVMLVIDPDWVQWLERLEALFGLDERLIEGVVAVAEGLVCLVVPLFEGRFGAAHAVEIGFVFDNLGRDGAMTLAGNEPPQALADAMHHAWVAFAAGGTPGWTPYDARERTVMRFAGAGGSIVVDPAAEERQLWDGVR